jgi:hypothetical protein
MRFSTTVRRIGLPLLLLAGAALSVSAASAQPAPAAAAATPPLTRAERTALDATAERGRLLIAIARAGIRGTQDMLTRLSDPAAAGVTGWIAEPEGNGMSVNFYASPESGPVTVYRVTVLGGRVTARQIYLGADRPPLNPIQVRMAAARAATVALGHRPCAGEEFNYLVVPPTAATANIDVYEIAPAMERGRLPLGGHHRTTVAPDGSIVSTRALTEGCASVDVPAATPGTPAAPIAVTHSADPFPNELHLFQAQHAGRTLRVTAGDPPRAWFVTNERIAAAE